MSSGFWETVDYHHRVLWVPTIYLERKLTEKTDAFVEFAGDYFAHRCTKELIHFCNGVPHDAEKTSWIFISILV